MLKINHAASSLQIEYDGACAECGGSGLVLPYGALPGAAELCPDCRGAGCKPVTLHLKLFAGRTPRYDVKRVFQVAPRRTLKDSDPLETYGGVSVEDWKSGVPLLRGTEDRRHTCPGWWEQWLRLSYATQVTKDWAECALSYGPLALPFRDCSRFCMKDKCWKKWDRALNKIEKKDNETSDA